jgi:ParB/RepB/Spo0J family partition protein
MAILRLGDSCMTNEGISYVTITDIKVNKRQRSDMGELVELAESIKEHGLLQPIGLDQDFNLVWGGRRLAAHVLNGALVVPARVLEVVDAGAAAMLEFIENNDRKSLTPEEEDKALLALHAFKTRDNNRLGVKKKHKAVDTAKLIGVSPQALSAKLKRAEAMAGLDSETRAQIYKDAGKSGDAVKRAAEQIQKQKDRKDALAAEALNRSDADRARLDKIVHQGNALELIKEVTTGSVDLVITDPPYGAVEVSMLGKQFSTGANSIQFDDNADKTYELLAELIPELFRVCRDGAHLYMFASLVAKDYNPRTPSVWSIGRLLMDAGFTVRPGALIWNKILNQGFAGNGTVWPFAHEACLFAKKGTREPNKMPRSDVLAYQPVTGMAKRHQFHKPENLYRQMLDVSGVKNGTFLDPFIGSGQSLVSAKEKGMRPIGFDSDPDACETARQMLEKGASK